MTEKKIKSVPEEKIALVKSLAKMMKSSKTILIASCKGLPSSQFHEIKKQLRGTADLKMVKKNIAIRALDTADNKIMKELKNNVTSDTVFFFSDKDAFALASILSEKQAPNRARAGDIAPEDIEIQPGPTDLVPGPAISELSGAGLKVAVKEGKLEIIKGAVVAKKGQAIKENVASVLGKLGIKPIKVGFLPVAAYDSQDDKVYVGIKIDKAGTLEELKEAIRKALGFATSIKYMTKETIKYFLAKASLEEKALERFINIKKEGS